MKPILKAWNRYQVHKDPHFISVQLKLSMETTKTTCVEGPHGEGVGVGATVHVTSSIKSNRIVF